jgi:integrase
MTLLDSRLSLPALAPLDAPALDPEALSASAERAIAELLAQGTSPSTERSYRAALRYWAAWFELRYRHHIALPLAQPVVLQFVIDHAERVLADGRIGTEMPPALDRILVEAGLKTRLGAPALATLVHRLAVLSKAHQSRSLENPCAAPAVRELMSRTRRSYASRGIRSQGKPALVREPLEQLLATCDGSPAGIRDRALILFAWASGGRRRSEVAEAVFENLQRTGPGAFVYCLGRSKTNQEGVDRPEDDKPLVGPAGQALEAWLEASRISSGALFRRVLRGGHVADEGLTPSAVRRIVKMRCAKAGLDRSYSAHSLRSGFVTEASDCGMALGDIMAMSGHASVATILRYHRRARASSNPAAQLLGFRPFRAQTSG